MNRAQFLQRLKDIGITQDEFAERTGVAPSTAYNWNPPGRPFPGWVSPLLKAWAEVDRLQSQIDKVRQGYEALRDV